MQGKHHNKIRISIVALAIFLQLFLAEATVMNSTNYSGRSIAISSGGTNMSSFNYNGIAIVNDIIGNMQSSSYSTLLGFLNGATDLISPGISLMSPANGSAYTVGTINVTYNLTDNNDIGQCTLTFGSENTTDTTIVKNVVQEFYFTPSAGVYNYYISCNDTFDNSNRSEVKLITINSPSATSSGAGGGGGGSDGIGGKTSNVDIEVEPALIKVSLKQGDVITYDIEVKNKGDSSVVVSIDAKKLEKYIKTFEDTFIIEAGKSKKLTLVVTSNSKDEPDVIVGNINIMYNDYVKQVPTIIEILSKEPLFDAKATVDAKYKKIINGGILPVDIKLINLGDLMKVDVEIDYIIKDMNDNIVEKLHETLAVERELEFTKNLTLPADLEDGKYVIYVKAIYDGKVTTASDLFAVEGKKAETPERNTISIIKKQVLDFLNANKKILLLLPVAISVIAMLIWVASKLYLGTMNAKKPRKNKKSRKKKAKNNRHR